jgi:hypothetical protein
VLALVAFPPWEQRVEEWLPEEWVEGLLLMPAVKGKNQEKVSERL